MTLDEAVNKAIEQIQGISNAMLVAGRNGKPIFMPDGRPAPGLQPPPLGNVLLVLLSTQSVILQVIRHTAVMLSGGFALSDQEASRIADIIAERIGVSSEAVRSESAVDEERAAVEESAENQECAVPGESAEASERVTSPEPESAVSPEKVQS